MVKLLIYYDNVVSAYSCSPMLYYLITILGLCTEQFLVHLLFSGASHVEWLGKSFQYTFTLKEAIALFAETFFQHSP